VIYIAKPQIGREEKEAVMAVMDSGIIACGSVVSDFEKAFAAYVGTAHGIATTSGTTALEVALRAMGIGKGDKVLTTAYSFIASTNSILYTGATPVFVDIDERTFQMNLAAAEDCLKENPDIRAMLIVHLFGQPCDMDGVLALAQKYDLRVLEDCAQSHGAKWKGKNVGGMTIASAFSFYPTKNMTTGEGGIVLTNDPELAEKARLLINHGMKIRYKHDILGYNYRMTNIAGAIGLEQLKKLDDFNKKRRGNAAYYDQNICNPYVDKPYADPHGHHVYHQYTIKVKDGKRDDLIKLFEENDIGYGVFYPTSIPEQPCFSEMGFRAAYPVVDRVKEQVLSIPVHPGLKKEETWKVADVICSLK